MKVDALGKAYTDDEAAKKAADGNASQAVAARQKLKDATDKAVKNAKTDVDDTTAAVAAKNLELARLKNNVIVATHLYELAKDKFDNLTSVKDLAKRNADHTAAQVEISKKAYDRTVAHMKVY